MNNEEFEIIAHSTYASDLGYRIVSHLDNPDDEIKRWAIMIVANLTWFSDEFYDDLFKDTDFICKLKELLTFNDNSILLDALISCSNILANKNPYRKAILQDFGVLINILFIIDMKDDDEVLQAALKALSNAFNRSHDPCVLEFCINNVEIIDVVVDKIHKKANTDTMLKISEVIKQLFAIGQSHIDIMPNCTANIFIDRIKNNDKFCHKFFEAQEHPTAAVYATFRDLVLKNFECEE